MEETAISGRSSLLQFAGCGGCHGASIDYRCSRLAVAARRAAAKGYPPDAPHTRLGFQPADLDSLSRPPESTAQTRRSFARLPPAHGGDRSRTGDGNRTPRRILERREWAGIGIFSKEAGHATPCFLSKSAQFHEKKRVVIIANARKCSGVCKKMKRWG